MDIDLEPGTYVVAVSGGVDSMVLLDLLVAQKAKNPKQPQPSTPSPQPWRLIVAHFDHGIRPDSEQDRRLVQETAAAYGLTFVFDRQELGPAASEAAAREARYGFLRKVRATTQADAIVTAHHQDDLIETAILNLLRGTGRKGLTSLAENNGIRRPLLNYTKRQLAAYAEQHGLKWREDPTNTDKRYARNRVRHEIIPRLKPAEAGRLRTIIEDMIGLNREIDVEIAKILQFVSKGAALERKSFIGLPHLVAREVMAEWLRRNGVRQFDQRLIERLVVAAKTLRPGKQTDVSADYLILVKKRSLALKLRSR